MKVRITEETIFTLLFTMIAAVIIYLSLQLSNSRSALVPLLIGIPTFIALLFQLILSIFPNLKMHISQKSSTKKKKAEFKVDSAYEQETNQQRRRRYMFSAWLIFFTLAIYYFGFVYTIPLALLIYFRWFAKLNWLKTVVATVGYFGFIYFFFVIFLRLNMP